jgi:hypothetical protein
MADACLHSIVDWCSTLCDEIFVTNEISFGSFLDYMKYIYDGEKCPIIVNG